MFYLVVVSNAAPLDLKGRPNDYRVFVIDSHKSRVLWVCLVSECLKLQASRGV